MINKLLTLVLLVMAIMIGITIYEHRKIPVSEMLTPAETDYVLKELVRLNAEPCVLESTAYGWKCTASRGKIYQVFPEDFHVRQKKAKKGG